MSAPSTTLLAFCRVLCATLGLSLTACEKKSGEAVVISKEYIAAAAPDAETRQEGQLSQEQWKVLVEMRSNLRKVNVLVEPPEWEKLQVGDRVNVTYSQGKYTGTVWSSEIK